MTQKDAPQLKISPRATERAIEELKRRGKVDWGATYYSQLAPTDLCRLAGRPRQVQYGALISWLKRLGETARTDPEGAVQLVAHLTNLKLDDCEMMVQPSDVDAHPRARLPERNAIREARLEVNSPSVVHDYRFVVVGELPHEHLYPAVFIQPLDGTGLWYPQMARHNPLQAGAAFACFVQLGNPAGIWHVKRPPLDATIRVYALELEWSVPSMGRMLEDALTREVQKLGVVAQRDSFTSRVWTDPLAPSLSDSGPFQSEPLLHEEPQVRTCIAPFALTWKGGAGYIEIREGDGDRLVFQGTAAPGAIVAIRGQARASRSAAALFELPSQGRYRVRLYPAVKSFLDPPYEWWLEIQGQ